MVVTGGRLAMVVSVEKEGLEPPVPTAKTPPLPAASVATALLVGTAVTEAPAETAESWPVPVDKAVPAGTVETAGTAETARTVPTVPISAKAGRTVVMAGPVGAAVAAVTAVPAARRYQPA